MITTNSAVVRKAVLLNQTRSPVADQAYLAGLPLLLRAVLSVQRAGVKEMLIVGGDHPGRLLERDRRVRLCWRWVPLNDSKPSSEVKALLRVIDELTENFVLLFADSIFEPQAVASLRSGLLGARVARAAILPGTKNGITETSLYVCSPDFIRLLAVMSAGGKILERIDSFVTQLREQDRADTVEVTGRVWSRATDQIGLSRIQRELVRLSLKKADGIYARFNKLVLSEPLIRLFLRTPATPNFITGLGLALAIGAAVAFAQGGYWWALVGSLIWFLSGLMDHVDGMVARLKFQESAFGTWFETAVDFASYLSVFTGLAIGLYRETGFAYHLVTGSFVALGLIASLVTTSRQRWLASADKPSDYVNRIHAQLAKQRRNFFHWFAHKCFFLTRRSVIPYFVILFCLLDFRVWLLGFATFGANLVWILTLYNNRLFRFPGGTSPA